MKNDNEGNISFDKFITSAEKQGWDLVNMGIEKITIIKESDQK
jgi:hypothetical protein